MTALKAENQHSTSSLFVSWQSSRGVYDSYRLQLLDESGTLVSNSSQMADVNQHYFRQLIPGKKYIILVQTVSGGISTKEVIADARTCMYTYTHLNGSSIRRKLSGCMCIKLCLL